MRVPAETLPRARVREGSRSESAQHEAAVGGRRVPLPLLPSSRAPVAGLEQRRVPLQRPRALSRDRRHPGVRGLCV